METISFKIWIILDLGFCLYLILKLKQLQHQLNDKDEYIQFLQEKNIFHKSMAIKLEAKRYEQEDLQLLEDIENESNLDY